MNPQILEDLARQLLLAREKEVPVRALDWPSLSTAEIYAIQDQCAQQGNWFRQGHPLAWKVGSANRDAQPNCAPLPDAGLIQSGSTVPRTRLPRLGIEAEVAIRLGRDVPGSGALGSSRTDIEALIDSLCVTIEIIDSRFVEGLDCPADRKLADLQVHGGLVIGEPIPFTSRNWASQRCVVSINSQIVADVTGTHPVGDPLWTTRWLIEHACRRFGAMRRGDLITTGAWAGIIPVSPGDSVEVRFEGLGQAHVRLAR